ncbi:MAG TPA: AraC family transcriptional regulator [Polyangia bacterium]|nr:AraC family transcriptional regulator [Polyangia bacterium]
MSSRITRGAAQWRHNSLDASLSSALAVQGRGPPAPAEWASHLHRLIDVSQSTVSPPSWWTPVNAYFGSVETRTDPRSYHWDGMKRFDRRDPPLAFFQLTLAGWGNFELYDQPPERMTPGRAFVAVVPSRHRYYLPAGSPGWTFAWIGIYHPYWVRRIKARVAATGPTIACTPDSDLVGGVMRLVRGVFHKDFRDRFDVEASLFDLILAYERLAESLSDPLGDRDRLLDGVRQRVLATPGLPVTVQELAADHGMSQSRFSHYFRARTGLTPANFIADVRVKEAARMLVETAAPLRDVSEMWGFANRSHFGKVFRRVLQMSPATYRSTISRESRRPRTRAP